MNNRTFLGTALSVLALGCTGAMAANTDVTFHFYGAKDCPPCMAFKQNHLEDVRADGQALGYSVEDNVIDRTRDVPNMGVYGERDPILRVAAQQLEDTYPPIFFVSKAGEVVSVHGPRWQDTFDAARDLAKE